MKNLGFFRRLGFAFNGFRAAFNSEASFQIQTLAAAFILIFLLIFRPEPVWWAIIALTVSSVLALELLNTSLEKTLDLLHPEKHELVRVAKDCAAGAVLVMSTTSLVVFFVLCFHLFIEKI